MHELTHNLSRPRPGEEEARLKEAQPIDFYRSSKTEDGKAFTDLIEEMLLTRWRKSKLHSLAGTAKTEIKRRLAIVSLTTNLAVQSLSDQRQYLYVPLNPAAYSPGNIDRPEVRYKLVKGAFDMLASPEEPLIEVVPGYHDPERRKGACTRIKASEYLNDLIDDLGVTLADFGISEDKPVLQCRSEKETSASGKGKVRGKLLPILKTKDNLRREAEMKEINAFLRNLQITCSYPFDPTQCHLVRIFNNGGFEEGGRLYMGWWQSIPSRARKSIRIDGEPVVELDFAQLHPTMLYGEYASGVPLKGDPYQVPGLPRKVAKKLFNAMINARMKLKQWPEGVDGTSLEMKVSEAQRLVLERHHSIEAAFFTGAGLRLQRQDSDMMVAILLELVGQDIPALPVHDSVIVPERHKETVVEVMRRQFKDRTGLEIEVRES